MMPRPSTQPATPVLSSSPSSMPVFVRVFDSPPSRAAGAGAITVSHQDDRTIFCPDPSCAIVREFPSFARAFRGGDSEDRGFDATTRPLVQSVLDGGSALLVVSGEDAVRGDGTGLSVSLGQVHLATGGRGSGRMGGRGRQRGAGTAGGGVCELLGRSYGLIDHAAAMMLSDAHRGCHTAANGFATTLRLRCYALDGERIIDLLRASLGSSAAQGSGAGGRGGNKRARVGLREHADLGATVSGLLEVEVQTIEDVRDLLSAVVRSAARPASGAHTVVELQHSVTTKPQTELLAPPSSDTAPARTSMLRLLNLAAPTRLADWDVLCGADGIRGADSGKLREGVRAGDGTGVAGNAVPARQAGGEAESLSLRVPSDTPRWVEGLGKVLAQLEHNQRFRTIFGPSASPSPNTVAMAFKSSVLTMLCRDALQGTSAAAAFLCCVSSRDNESLEQALLLLKVRPPCLPLLPPPSSLPRVSVSLSSPSFSIPSLFPPLLLPPITSPPRANIVRTLLRCASTCPNTTPTTTTAVCRTTQPRMRF